MKELVMVTPQPISVLTLMIKVYTEPLLKDESALDSHLQPISGLHPEGLDLHRGSPKR